MNQRRSSDGSSVDSFRLELTSKVVPLAKTDGHLDAKKCDQGAHWSREELIALVDSRITEGRSDETVADPLDSEKSDSKGAVSSAKNVRKDSTTRLSEDSFSFLMFTSYSACNIMFVYAIVTCCTQLLIYVLVVTNTTNDVESGNNRNVFNFPPNVDMSTRIAQLVAIVISIFMQDDVITALNLITDGYDQSSFGEAFDGASFGKWVFSVSSRFVEGGFGLIVTFLLIMQSEQVVDLLLNFTAMEFVSNLDRVAFNTAANGYIGERGLDTACTVSDTEYRIMKRRLARSRRRSVLLLLIFFGLICGWAVIIINQRNGKYSCQTIFVQFGDEAFPSLGAFSGLYKIDASAGGGPFTNMDEGFVRYYLESTTTQDEEVFFAHCTGKYAWTFSFSTIANNNPDPCGEWSATSSQTKSYDILTTADSDWLASRIRDKREVLLEHFSLSCYDCTDDFCGERGQCDENSCKCDPGWFGLRCEFRKPCQSMELNPKDHSIDGYRGFSSQYDTLQFGDGTDVKVYNRPVYVSENDEFEFDIIMFTGMRWISTFGSLLADFTNPKDGSAREQLAMYLANDFHAQYSKYDVEFITESMIVDTHNDAATPNDLKWFHAQSREVVPYGIQPPDLNQEVDAVFLCV